MSRLRGQSQNRETQESCPEAPGAVFQRKHFGAAKARPRLMGLLLALITLLAYLPAAYHGFSIFDDNDYITKNHVVQNGLTWAGVKWAFTTDHASNWHPVTWLSHMADCEFFGLKPGAHHLVNVLFHTANAVLLFALLLRLTGKLWPSAFVAALFAWHPLHVESVAWVSERKDVLSTFFALLTLLAYARHAQKQSKVEGRESKANTAVPALGSRLWTLDYALALFFFTLGLMSKPMLVTLPFVMLLLDYWPLQRFPPFWRLAFEKWPFFVLVAVSCVMTFLAQHHGGMVVSLEEIPLHRRLDNVPLAYVLYLLKMLWPVHLAIFYPLPRTISPPAVVAAAAVLLAISAGVWFGRKRAPYWLVGWLWFLGTLVPVIGMVQVGYAAIADRYTYFPSIGMFIALTFAVRDRATRLQFPFLVTTTAAVLILGGCLALTENQLRCWRDDKSLFSHAISVTKNNEPAHLSLGLAYEMEGRNADARAEYRISLELNPYRAKTYNDLARVLAKSGYTNEALAEFREAVRIKPKSAALHDNLGAMLVDFGRFDEAMEHYAEAAQLDPADLRAPYLMGKALLKQGRDVEAIPYFRQAMQINPDDIYVLNYLALVLASDGNPMVRDGHTAFALASRANTLTGSAQPAMLDTLGMACAELGLFDDAQKAAQKAINLIKASGMTNAAAAVQQRLQLYQNHQPFRQFFSNAPSTESPKR